MKSTSWWGGVGLEIHIIVGWVGHEIHIMVGWGGALSVDDRHYYVQKHNGLDLGLVG